MFCWFVNINNQYITKRHKARWANIYKSEELEESSTCAKNAQVRIEGKRMIQRDIPFYNLDMIISVGYRVNSRKATTFPRCPDIDDCREPYGRERCNGESGGKSNQ